MNEASNPPQESLPQAPPEPLCTSTAPREQTEQRIKEYVRQAANDLIAMADTDVESWPKKQFRDALDFALAVNSAQAWFKEGGYNEARIWISGAPLDDCPDPPNPRADQISKEFALEQKEREKRNKTTLQLTVEISDYLRRRMSPMARPTKKGRHFTVKRPLAPRVLDALGMLTHK